MISSEERKEVRGAAYYALRWFFAIFILSSLLGVAMWAFGVFTSDINGRGNAIKVKNSATNRIAAQERFEEMYQDGQAANQRIGAMRAALAATPNDTIARTNLNGAVNYCIEVRAKYNAEARKYTAAQFRASDLPENLNEIDCKGTE
jgi:hypothetical protein